MPKMPEKKCKACGGSGVSSRGKPCVPCELRKKPPTPQVKATVKKPFSIFD